MSLAPGIRLGPYEIVAPIGAGGMGEVYRAKDTNLNRDVALKILPESFALDADRVARFKREAQVLASLNHPNIAAIYAVETTPDVVSTALVMELVEGEDLSAIIARSPIAIADALPLAKQIADALEAAHEQGIVHRDLKPANIKVRADGTVKVLDFGLAKALAPEGASATAEAMNSPTMTARATAMGMIIGTAAYMSPEQAKGKAVDKRADIWAFGVVLYEMLSGRRAFAGEDITDTLTAVLRDTPDFAALPAGTPQRLRRLLERCLDRDIKMRLRDIGEARVEIAKIESGVTDSSSMSGASAMSPPGRRALGLPIVVATIAATVLATVGATLVLTPTAAPPANNRVVSLTIALPEGDVVGSTQWLALAVSPDGSHVAYIGVRGGKSQLFVRALAEPEPKALDGTDFAAMPFFDPSGRWIGFFAQGKLKKIGIGGAGLTVVTDDAPFARGGTWATDDTIYFAPSSMSGLFAVPAAGGTPKAVTRLDPARGEVSHRWPQILPDQRTILFSNWIGPGVDERQVAVLSLTTGERHILVPGGDTPRYVDGYLVYGRKDSLFAVPWQPSHTAIGQVESTLLPAQPRFDAESANYAVSDHGVLAYLQGSPARHESRVLWVDRDGHSEALPVPARSYELVSLSPDGRRAVVQINENSVTLWLYDFSRNTLTPFVTPGGSSQAPVWTPNGERVIYRGTRAGTRNLYWRRADGMGVEEVLTKKDAVIQTAQSVSPDGRWLVFSESGANGASDILAIDLTGPDAAGPRTPRVLAQTPARETNGRVSPDGHWLAFISDASGRDELYVQPFPDPGPSQQVSVGGATEPIWSHSGRELFYRPASGDGLMVVPVTLAPTFVPGQPRVQFQGRFKLNVNSNTPYDISLDDRRFLRVQPGRVDSAITRIEVMLNWLAVRKPSGVEK